MPAVLYTCPITLQRVTGWVADSPENNDDRLAALECIACRRVHAIHPRNGKVYGQDDKQP